ncbi:hypothetical protein SAY87_011795 [Trapa incisa]|uniref:Uncharacterized protein n=1 Tax=Trapa incisa TaxID=236973 RepID=A0AAN7GJ16_9MYRT|nr:hypothetical protein SAY87_011795 [Trapa incisa]
MGGAGELVRRIPRIRFPQRHPKTSSGSGSASGTADAKNISVPMSDVPAAPSNMAVGGKATLQPKRTPVSDREIEAIMVIPSREEDILFNRGAQWRFWSEQFNISRLRGFGGMWGEIRRVLLIFFRNAKN